MISVKTLKGILGCLAAVVVLAGCSSAYKPMEVYTGGQEERQVPGGPLQERRGTGGKAAGCKVKPATFTAGVTG